MTMYEYDNTTVLCATVTRVDESFDHEFGTERGYDFAIENFCVMATVGGFEEDVTECLSGKRIEYFREWFRDRHIAEHEAVA